MGGIYVAVLMLTALGAVLSIPIFYLWAWSMGPAFKYLGRKWEEGRQQANNARQADLHEAYRRGLDDAWSGNVIRTGASIAAPAPAPTNTALPTPKYTITGKQVR